MSTLKHFLKVYPKVLQILQKYGFQQAILFKGFSQKEEHNLNVLISDKFSETEESKPQTIRKLELHDELTVLLNCKIILTLQEDIRPHYVKKLDTTNSIKLTETLDSKQVEMVFGNSYRFNPIVQTNFWKTEEKPKLFQPSNNDKTELNFYFIK